MATIIKQMNMAGKAGWIMMAIGFIYAILFNNGLMNFGETITNRIGMIISIITIIGLFLANHGYKKHDYVNEEDIDD